MYKTIDFPEGTSAKILGGFWADAYDSSYHFNEKFNGEILIINGTAGTLGGIKPFDFSGVKLMQDLTFSGERYLYIPAINLSSCQEFNNSGINGSFNEKNFLVLEGSLENLNKLTSPSIGTNVVINYPTGQPITVLQTAVPPNKFIPYGDVPVKLRVMKDGAWMDGTEEVLYDNEPMEYKGQGIYEIVKTVLPRKRFNFPVRVGEYFVKSPDVSDSIQICYVGDNSGNVITAEGADILNLASDNSNGWFYDDTNNGITNNDINGGQSTTLTLNIPSLSIDIVYGQSSEKNYDYMTVLDGDGKVLFTAKGVEGTNKTATINNTSNTYVFKYQKDGSGDGGTDSCWINSITYTSLPPYPTN